MTCLLKKNHLVEVTDPEDPRFGKQAIAVAQRPEWGGYDLHFDVEIEPVLVTKFELLNKFKPVDPPTWGCWS
jgi:hypothetical protein